MEKTVIVKGGDTLGDIAMRELGHAGLWTRIYARNESVIIEYQEKHGVEPHLRRVGIKRFVPSDWIFPGMHLVVPVA